ncbi:fumarate reductase subunit C [Psychromonas sp. Urea-02u-13]|uniref:fumarate reductase subunit C n=1 Tax=Psychromonas sp. Urea-02u-13 TaxID=2058326 RepID=UPI000C33386F|nr:fumarate reductase subunit C [Psychromonas sp. Urea-02u-13]PKG40811.1 fumarate reductase subunit C [Psychromonas sp. Urea-02u-13]
MSKRKPYTRELPNDWWMKQLFYTKYMLREGSSVFITLYSLILAWGILRLSQGEVAFNAWMQALQNPFSIFLHSIALAFALYHTITWFSLAPKAVDLWIKGKRLDDKIIVSGHYAGFVGITLFCLLVIIL